MLVRTYKYIFYRLNRHQKRQIDDPTEAVLSAICFLSFPPLVLFGLIDAVLSVALGTTSFATQFGKLLYVIAFVLIFLLHYRFLASGDRASKIMQEFRDNKQFSDIVGSTIVALFFTIPTILFIGLIVAERVN